MNCRRKLPVPLKCYCPPKFFWKEPCAVYPSRVLQFENTTTDKQNCMHLFYKVLYGKSRRKGRRPQTTLYFFREPGRNRNDSEYFLSTNGLL